MRNLREDQILWVFSIGGTILSKISTKYVSCNTVSDSVVRLDPVRGQHNGQLCWYIPVMQSRENDFEYFAETE